MDEPTAMFVEQFVHLKQEVDAYHWAMGDIAAKIESTAAPPLARGKGRPKTVWTQLSQEVGYAPKTIEQWAYTAKMFPEAGPDQPWRRRSHDEYLTFWHHLLVAYTDDPLRWLELAEERMMSLAELRAAMREEKTAGDATCVYRNDIKAIYCKRQTKTVEAEECESCVWNCNEGVADGTE
jgi:hypothetical protein